MNGFKTEKEYLLVGKKFEAQSPQIWCKKKKKMLFYLMGLGNLTLCGPISVFHSANTMRG